MGKKKAKHIKKPASAFDLSFDNDVAKLFGVKEFPYPVRLSFIPLIEHWRAQRESKDAAAAFLAREIERLLKKAPELLQPIEDEGILDDHQDLVYLLLAGLFPIALRSTQKGKASAPFESEGFYKTPGLIKFLQEDEYNITLDNPQFRSISGQVIRACSYILNKFYNQNISLDTQQVFRFESKSTGQERFFKSEMNITYADVIARKPLREISQIEINDLLSNVYDINKWLEYFPPENFEFQGIISNTLIDVTHEQTLSQLKYQLLEKDALINEENIVRLEALLRTYLEIPDLHLGISAVDYPVSSQSNHQYKIRYHLLADVYPILLNEENEGSVYHKACEFKENLLLENLAMCEDPTRMEVELLDKGYQSIIVIPLLQKNNRVVGIMEVASKRSYGVNSFNEVKLNELTPLFATAVQRSRAEIDNQIEAIIRERYTSLHPSVEWKFMDEAFHIMEQLDAGNERVEARPIIFRNVFPLYGQADIVSSSEVRNKAIRSDLLKNLKMLRKCIRQVLVEVSFPLADHYMIKINEEIDRLKEGIHSNDEFQIQSFIVDDIHTMLEELSRTNPVLKNIIQPYFDALDPDLNVIYKKRREFDKSVARINEAISSYLEKEEKKAQDIFPHFFEKFQTDGIEYDIYVGQSLMQKGHFSELYLRNLRVWQLIIMSEITQQVAKLQNELPMPLQTAQLILVHSNSLSIRFRMDEKRFDVDGAYNIRYEIIKKRIDKALVAGTNERLTQTGKIAVVYLNNKDREEYRMYLDYLIAKGYITEDIEDLDLKPLQGVEGLKALRITPIVRDGEMESMPQREEILKMLDAKN